MSTASSAKTRVAIVTGASRGIGAACVAALAQRGYKVVAMSRSKSIRVTAKKYGALAVQGSVTEARDLKRLVKTAMGKYGRIDAVVNGSGHPESGDLLSISDELWTEVFTAYFLGVVRMSRLVVPHMAAQGGGAFVNISGSDVYEPDARFAAASVIRASMTSYTKLFAQQHAAKHIRMNCVAPNVVFDHEPANVREDLRRELPIQRPAFYREVTDVVAFLLSPEASYISGETVRVDGGASKAV